MIIQELGNPNEQVERARLRVSLGQQWPLDYKSMQFVAIIIPYFIGEETGQLVSTKAYEVRLNFGVKVAVCRALSLLIPHQAWSSHIQWTLYHIVTLPRASPCHLSLPKLGHTWKKAYKLIISQTDSALDRKPLLPYLWELFQPWRYIGWLRNFTALWKLKIEVSTYRS